MIALTGQKLFIAGGSRGIGAAAARSAARAGADVAVNYLSHADAAAQVVGEIEREGRRGLALQADIADEDQIRGAIETAASQFGGLTGLVVSAGIFEGCPIEQMTLGFWNRTVAVNLTGTFLAVRESVKHLRAAGGGSIVIYTSTAGQRGSDIFSAYATTKGAQILFMRSMAKELARDNIRVNCIAPAWTETEMAAPSLDALGREEVAKTFPLGRIGLPEDVAGATLFLLSPLAGFVTGITLTVDGGMDMRG